MKEAMGNLERWKHSLLKLEERVKELISMNTTSPAVQSKIERIEEEFLKVNWAYDTPFHNFKHSQVSINPQNAQNVFESIGTIKNPIVVSNS